MTPRALSRRRSQPIRVAAALLAWAGLVLVPTRVLADCSMVDEGEVIAAEVAARADDSHAGHGDHAHADEDATAAEGPDVPAQSPAPTHPDCPDLLHCAVAALTPSYTALDGFRRLPEDAQLGAPGAPRAPPRVIDTPPPRA